MRAHRRENAGAGGLAQNYSAAIALPTLPQEGERVGTRRRSLFVAHTCTNLLTHIVFPAHARMLAPRKHGIEFDECYLSI